MLMDCKAVSYKRNFGFDREFKPDEKKFSQNFHSVNQELPRKAKDYPFFLDLFFSFLFFFKAQQVRKNDHPSSTLHFLQYLLLSSKFSILKAMTP
jgi:hypothetical protein